MIESRVMLSANPAWLNSDGAASWNASTATLTVTGSATIIADPGADEPNIVASGTAAKLTIAPATGPADVHLGGITLSGGATLTVASVGPARTNSYHNVVVLGTLGSTNDPTLSIDSSSAMDLKDNDLIIHTGSSDAGGAGAYATAYALADTGRHSASGTPGQADGQWNGNGLNSSAAAGADAAAGYETLGLAVVVNNTLALGAFPSWQVGSATETLGSNDVIVKYTYLGDYALEGAIGDDNAGILQLEFDNGASSNHTWATGSSLYDGLCDSNESGLFQLQYGLGTGPSGFTASGVSASEIDLSWTNFSGSPATAIEVDQSTDGQNYTAIATGLSPSTTTYQATGLQEGTHYWYEVKATGSNNYSESAGPVDSYTLPAAPSALSATAVSSSEVDLAWTNNSIYATGINVLRSTDGVNFTSLGTIDPSQVGYVDTNLLPNTHYWYEIAAVTPGSTSALVSADAYTVTAPSTTTTLAPIADAYGRDGSYADTNFGSATDLQVKNSDVGWNRESYLTFDAGGLQGNVTNATLRLYGQLESPGSSYVVDAVPIDASWSEGTLTWNNRPADASSAIASATIGTTPGWYNWDVTDYVNSQLMLGITTITIGLEGDVYTSGQYVDFNSREAASNAPQLNVTTDVETFAPTGATYVSSANANTNYDTSGSLLVGSSSATTPTNVTFLTFDTSAVNNGNDLANALLELYGSTGGSSDSNITVAAYPVSNTSWSPGTVTWNTAPSYDTTNLLCTTTIVSNSPALYTWDLTNYINTQRQHGTNVISVALVATTATNNPVTFSSPRGANAPYLWTSESPISILGSATSTSVTLRWQPVPGAVSYDVYRSTTQGDPGTEIASGITTTSYVDANPPTSQTPYYLIVASNGQENIQLPAANSVGTPTDPNTTGQQLTIQPPTQINQITYASTIAAPDLYSISVSSSGDPATKHEKTSHGRVGVPQWRPTWPQLVGYSDDVSITRNFSYTASGPTAQAGGSEYLFEINVSFEGRPPANKTTPNPDWEYLDSLGGPVSDTGGSYTGTYTGAVTINARPIGYGVENLSVRSVFDANANIWADGNAAFAVDGMWTGYFSMTYTYI
jgi:hypothetical protein